LLLCSLDYDYTTFDVASGKKLRGEGSAMRHRLSGVILDWPQLQKERAWADAFSFDGKTRTEDGGWRGSHRMMALRDHGTDRPFAVVDFASVKAFSPDGRWLAASDDTTILIYDVAQLRVEFLCEELLAGRKGSRLKRNAAGIVREVGVQLRRLVTDETRAAPLIRDLDADDFATREKATAELGKMGVGARLPLLQARARSKSPEVRRRAAQLLLRLDGKGGDLTLAGLERALGALAKWGGQARGLVEELSRGPKDAAVTRAARKALGK